MAQGDFSAEEAKQNWEGFKEVFEAVPKSKRGGFLGHMNDMALFLGKAEKAADVLNRVRLYFLDEKGGEESPFVKVIDGLGVPRAPLFEKSEAKKDEAKKG